MFLHCRLRSVGSKSLGAPDSKFYTLNFLKNSPNNQSFSHVEPALHTLQDLTCYPLVREGLAVTRPQNAAALGSSPTQGPPACCRVTDVPCTRKTPLWPPPQDLPRASPLLGDGPAVQPLDVPMMCPSWKESRLFQPRVFNRNTWRGFGKSGCQAAPPRCGCSKPEVGPEEELAEEHWSRWQRRRKLRWAGSPDKIQAAHLHFNFRKTTKNC